MFLFILILSQIAVLGEVPLKAATAYQSTWASVDTHNPAPEWFQDAKFGIYFHWGVFSVPAFSSEWYPRNMYHSGSSEYNHHLSVYGDAYSNWPYHNFINGAYDKSGNWTQFAPKLVSAGGNFDPNAWAQLFVDAGAKFAGPVAEHHDGFSMWNSTVNEWNSVAKGPHLDLVGQFAAAIRAKGLKFLVSSHNAYNFTGYYQWVPAQSDSSLKKLYGQLDKATEEQLWYNKLKELIDQYQPDIIWQDFNLSQISESQRLNFLAYYYNKGVDWGKEVVATYKDGFDNKGEIFDYERGGPAGITSPYWLTDDSISSSSWCYTQGIGYYSTVAMLHSLIDRVSKNGNMLLNIAPMADGTIPQGQKDILLGMGDWLKKFGEAIYATRAWSCYGEGPTAMGGGSFTTPVAGTNKDIRFTRNKANNTLYAVVLGWPGNGAQLQITTLNSSRFDISTLTSAQLLGASAGAYTNLAYSQNSTALNVTMPSAQPYSALAYVVKLTFSDIIPTLGSGGGAIDTSKYYKIVLRNNNSDVLDVNAANYANGTNVAIWADNGGANQQWKLIDVGGGYYEIASRGNQSYCLDESQVTPVNGSNVQIWQYQGNDRQQWKLVDAGGGYYEIQLRNNSSYGIDESQVTPANGSNVQIWQYVGNDRQQWKFVAVP